MDPKQGEIQFYSSVMAVLHLRFGLEKPFYRSSH